MRYRDAFKNKKQFNEAGTMGYEGEVVFRQEIKGSGCGAVKCVVGYQCCNSYVCIPPAEVELVAKVK